MLDYKDLKKSMREGRRQAEDGDVKAAERAFAKARKVVSAYGNTDNTDGCLQLSRSLLEVANAQAEAGLWRSAQRTFVAARKAAKKASTVVTRRLERAEAIDRVGQQEAVAMMINGRLRAARQALKRTKDIDVRTRTWLEAGIAGAKAGVLDHARTAFAEARSLASKMPDDGSRGYWMSEIASEETEALAKAARSRKKTKGSKKSRAVGTTAKFAEKAIDGDIKALKELLKVVRTGTADEARIAVHALGAAGFVDKVDRKLSFQGLLEAFAHKDAETREIAAEKLESLIMVGSVLGFPEGLMGGELTLKLSGRLTDKSPRIRKLTAEGLTWLRDPAALPDLVKALRPPGFFGRMFEKKIEGEARAASAKALGMMMSEGREAVKALIKTTRKDPDPDARVAAMKSLGMIGDPRAIKVAVAQKDDPVTGYEARTLIINFRDNGLVDEQQMAMIRHGLGDEAFD